MTNKKFVSFLNFNYKYSCFMEDVVNKIVAELNNKINITNCFKIENAVYRNNIFYGYNIKRMNETGVSPIYIGLNYNFLENEGYGADDSSDRPIRAKELEERKDELNRYFLAVDILKTKLLNKETKVCKFLQWEAGDKYEYGYFEITKELLNEPNIFSENVVNIIKQNYIDFNK